MAGGRQREFDEQEALEKAMHVFWRKGYLGASLNDLTQSMGINKPSLYATFGNKEALFIRATERYIAEVRDRLSARLHQENKPLKERVREYVIAVLEMQCDKTLPSGCYLSLCMSESAGEGIPEKARSMIKQASSFSEDYLTAFFQEEIDKENLGERESAHVLSLYLLTVLNGSSAIARGGKSFDDMQPIVDQMLRAIQFQ